VQSHLFREIHVESRKRLSFKRISAPFLRFAVFGVLVIDWEPNRLSASDVALTTNATRSNQKENA